MSATAPPTTQTVTLTIDGIPVSVPKGTLLVEAAKTIKQEIPVYCYHTKLGPAGLCRICLVEIEGIPKLQIACNTVVTDGMVVMRMLAEGKTNRQITAEAGILSGSIAAYKAWNTMYAASIKRGVHKRIKIKGRIEAEQAADIAFLRACGIAFEMQPHDEAEVE